MHLLKLACIRYKSVASIVAGLQVLLALSPYFSVGILVKNKVVTARDGRMNLRELVSNEKIENPDEYLYERGCKYADHQQS